MNRIKGWFYLRFYPGAFLKRFSSPQAKLMFFLKQYEATQKRVWVLEYVLDDLKEGK